MTVILLLSFASGALLLHLVGWGAVFAVMGLLLLTDAVLDLRRYRKPTHG